MLRNICCEIDITQAGPDYYFMDSYFIDGTNGHIIFIREHFNIININKYLAEFNCKLDGISRARIIGSKENLLLLCEDLNRLQKELC